MEYSISYANKRAERGDKTGLARLTPSMTAAEREAAHYAAGEISQRAIEQATADFEINQASGSSHHAKATPSSRPSTGRTQGKEETEETGWVNGRFDVASRPTT